MIPNQHSSHLHEDIQQLDAAAQEGRHRFVSHPDILHKNSQIFSTCFKSEYLYGLIYLQVNKHFE